MRAFSELRQLQPLRIWDGVVGRVIGGEQLTLAIVELDADSLIPEHSHINEQVGVIVAGGLTFRIGNEERELGPGDGWAIPPHVPHEVHTGAEGAIVVETFVPPRDDWQALERLEFAPPRWPVSGEGEGEHVIRNADRHRDPLT